MPLPVIQPPVPPASIEFFDRRVGKSGAVCISGLPQGVRVHVAHVSPGVYVVSALPEADVRHIVEQMPKPAPSPYATLAASLAERKRPAEPVRKRHAFTGIVEEPVEPVTAVLARAQLQKPSRPPR